MRPLLLTSFLVQAAALTSTAAFADEKAACLEAVSKGQTLRDEHKLVEARDQFRACARAQCPAVVQTDCASFLEAVEKSLPSVVFTAKDATGAEVSDVKVSVDGQPLVTRLDGAAVAMNPGPHTFVFTSGAVSAKRTATILEGARNQIIGATIATAPASRATMAPPPSVAPLPARPAAAASTEKAGGAGWFPVTAISVGGVGLAAGVVLTILAHGKRADGDDLCPSGVCPDADASQIASLNNQATTFGEIATTAYIVGGVALAAGLIVLLAEGGHPSRTGAAHAIVAPILGRGTGGFGGVF
jgi:hypothetical protein